MSFLFQTCSYVLKQHNYRRQQEGGGSYSDPHHLHLTEDRINTQPDDTDVNTPGTMEVYARNTDEPNSTKNEEDRV